ncbi:hypothetical protein SARC_01963 [Sphaeroforma arctica JP610]|uniref:Fork-head domain-containing protein n=1 Tax=Sphaeroforma arctica JP610 TaxID=667725 RepID=A0A0L0GAC0_9EUKA|nr:hypothetical protein SARC_01963 [Sphaeroforma arctica JP610]KNC85854.1 hypothetical protein SARC_01963 [Sphaeroforma arctica JP610]|eukprot:XP_014159756.1 hypothetical protein SARC_01963 [Sphaeroforma arctica JP610]
MVLQSYLSQFSKDPQPYVGSTMTYAPSASSSGEIVSSQVPPMAAMGSSQTLSKAQPKSGTVNNAGAGAKRRGDSAAANYLSSGTDVAQPLVNNFWEIINTQDRVDMNALNTSAQESVGTVATADVFGSALSQSESQQQPPQSQAVAKPAVAIAAVLKTGEKSIKKVSKPKCKPKKPASIEAERESTIAAGATTTAQNSPIRAEPQEPEKPSFSYATLIAMAINDSTDRRLTLSGIYKWIEDHYKYYDKQSDSSWKNSIRHNLSLKPCFYKSPRQADEPGKGAWWSIDDTQIDGGRYSAKRKRPSNSVQRTNSGTKIEAAETAGGAGDAKTARKKAGKDGKQVTKKPSADLKAPAAIKTDGSRSKRKAGTNGDAWSDDLPSANRLSTETPQITSASANGVSAAFATQQQLHQQAVNAQLLLNSKQPSMEFACMTGAKNFIAGGAANIGTFGSYQLASTSTGVSASYSNPTTSMEDDIFSGLSMADIENMNINAPLNGQGVSFTNGMGNSGFTVSPQLLHGNESPLAACNLVGHNFSDWDAEGLQKSGQTAHKLLEPSYSQPISTPSKHVDIKGFYGLYDDTVVTPPDNLSLCGDHMIDHHELYKDTHTTGLLDLDFARSVMPLGGMDMDDYGHWAESESFTSRTHSRVVSSSFDSACDGTVATHTDTMDVVKNRKMSTSTNGTSSLNDDLDMYPSGRSLAYDYSCGSSRATFYDKTGETELLDSCRDWILGWETTNCGTPVRLNKAL